MEPENHLFEQEEDHLPNLHFGGFKMSICQGGNSGQEINAKNPEAVGGGNKACVF